MYKKKQQFLILNPSRQTLSLISDEKKLRNIVISFLDTNIESKGLVIATLNNSYYFDKIFIENYNGMNFDNDVLLLINKIRVLNNKIYDISNFIEKYFKKVQIINLNGDWVSSRELINLEVNSKIEVYKRFFDLLFIIFSLPISLLLFLIGAFIVKLSSQGPIIFKQSRIGKNGKHFKLYKLRTMYFDSTFKGYTTENDKRIFPLGKILRTTKIDELPQFFNILLGQMSLIGPRPETVEIVNELDSQNSYYELRHLIRPGLTGWAQVNDPRANPSKNFQKLEYDLYYVKNLHLFLDFKIMLKTIKIILQRDSL